MSLISPPALRVLLGAAIVLLIAGCTPRSVPTPPAAPQAVVPRWVVLGDAGTGPDAATLASLLPAGRHRSPEVMDLSAPRASIESVIGRQLPRMPEAGVELTVLRLGTADLAAPSPAAPERFAELVGALVRTLTAPGHGPMLVTTIAESPQPALTGEDRLAAARRLRLASAHNAAIRAAARTYGAVVVELDRPPAAGPDAARWDALMPWRLALEATTSARLVAGNLPSAGPDMAVMMPDATALSALRQRAARAVAAGHRPNVAAKIGDSITSSPSFLAELANADLGPTAHAGLLATIGYFNQASVSAALDEETGTDLDAELGPVAVLTTPFARQSLAARVQWAVADVVIGGSASPLARELGALRPGVALVMFGTNDLTRSTVGDFEAEMDRLLRELEAMHVIPVLSTIPGRTDRSDFATLVPEFNAAIRALATVHGLPLVEYDVAMARLPNGGLSEDGIHPNVCPEGSAVLTPACLRYGYNLRNLLTLQALEQLRAEVLDPPDRLTADVRAGR